MGGPPRPWKSGWSPMTDGMLRARPTRRPFALHEWTDRTGPAGEPVVCAHRQAEPLQIDSSTTDVVRQHHHRHHHHHHFALSSSNSTSLSSSVILPCTLLPKFQRTEIFCRNTMLYLLCRFFIDPISTSSVLSILRHLKSRARFISAVYYNNCDKKLCNIFENEKKYCYVKNVKIK